MSVDSRVRLHIPPRISKIFVFNAVKSFIIYSEYVAPELLVAVFKRGSAYVIKAGCLFLFNGTHLNVIQCVVESQLFQWGL